MIIIRNSENGRFERIDCVGQIINGWEILEQIPNAIRSTSKYVARCIHCGAEIVSSMHTIRHGSGCKCQKPEPWEHNIGKTFGCLTVISALDKTRAGEPRKYKCVCGGCGQEFIYSINKICRLQSTECFHINKYGVSRQKINTWKIKELGYIYRGMVKRCYDEKLTGKDWKNYGGKGIKVCEKWLNNPSSFQDWALANGYDKSLSIDRIDSNGDYCPENCRWITIEENVKRAAETLITVDDETHNLTEWSHIIGKGKRNVGYYYRTYGEEYTIQYIKDMMSCGQNLQTKQAHLLNIDGDIKTITDWAKCINVSPDTLSAYVVSHGDDDTIRHIKEIIEYGYDSRKGNRVYLTINGDTHLMSEWDKILGCRSDTVGKRYRKYGREAAMQFIQAKLKE